MKTSISTPLMKARLERLLSAVKVNSRDILRERIGKMEEVLLETATSGRTSSNFTCFTDRAGSPGELLKVKITGAEKNVLNGKVMR
jgi:tRNA A37 methylthiotransferase MiaB